MRLTFATGNTGKFVEAREALAPLGIELHQWPHGYAEPQASTLDEVAAAGLDELADRIEGPFFLEDAGLFIDALGGFPGVYSAYVHRTVGCPGILRLLDGDKTRDARFEAVIGYHDGTAPQLVRGVCPGRIADDERGSTGFGFDPIFVPEGAERTFAEMGPGEKNAVSHRGRALKALTAVLQQS